MTALEAALRAELVQRVNSRRWYRAHRDWHMRDLEAENERVLRLLLRLRREGRVRIRIRSNVSVRVNDGPIETSSRRAAYTVRVAPITESEYRLLDGNR